ncbi:FHA domain-containing protein [Mucilaginibacter auburnensis]|uniref:FHA domain-containing protein n=1 Tax=Mucilaginibacter auburnensis TaxID=1457233 RepID=A0A2H9VL16_9SPHI|nr:FHA domain-containing protein [Mucilaginibacter auburnensis]PJJ79039.1 FHA domain-containing protein [Mucilaginibacter auburnensis]
MVFNFFNNDADERPSDVKGVRHALLQFIKQQLQKAEGGEGGNIKGVCLYINTTDADKHVYEAAVYAEQPQLLRDEIQRTADDYAVALPTNWSLDVIFDENIPTEATKALNIDAAFFVKTAKHAIKKEATAYIRALSGETLESEYILKSESGKINIGRDKKTQSDEGYFRTNHIAFPSESKSKENRFISRQHAHIEWNNDAGRFMIFADEGGIPPRNKVKIRSEANEQITKLHATHIGHELQEGDQIVLGESAVIEFSYKSLKNE